jgi:hypothetical protein
MPIWVYFGGPLDGKFVCISWSFGIFIAILVKYVANLYFCGHFGIFFPFWFVVPRKIWQPCLRFHFSRTELQKPDLDDGQLLEILRGKDVQVSPDPCPGWPGTDVMI